MCDTKHLIYFLLTGFMMTGFIFSYSQEYPSVPVNQAACNATVIKGKLEPIYEEVLDLLWTTRTKVDERFKFLFCGQLIAVVTFAFAAVHIFENWAAWLFALVGVFNFALTTYLIHCDVDSDFNSLLDLRNQIGDVKDLLGSKK